jgi:methionyl-tRNA formyltransferase
LVTLLLNPKSPTALATLDLLKKVRDFQDVDIKYHHDECLGGNFLFALSYAAKIPGSVLSQYENPLVLHGSDLPIGKGWSPAVWGILQGSTEVTMSLVRAVAEIDSGPVIAKLRAEIPKSMLWREINAVLAGLQAQLMTNALSMSKDELSGVEQIGPDSFFRRRTPEDSRIDPAKSILDQWDLIRVADPQRYPSFFELFGQRYVLDVRKDTRHGDQ